MNTQQQQHLGKKKHKETGLKLFSRILSFVFIYLFIFLLFHRPFLVVSEKPKRKENRDKVKKDEEEGKESSSVSQAN